MEKIAVSACLLGVNCKYSGGNNKNEDVLKLAVKFELVPVCPESYGGLPIPREPSELRGGRVWSKSGKDVTAAFEAGAQKALEKALANGCRTAVLKERSPSCGSGKIYDGTFTGTLTDGSGVAAALFAENGIAVLGESRVGELLR